MQELAQSEARARSLGKDIIDHAAKGNVAAIFAALGLPFTPQRAAMTPPGSFPKPKADDLDSPDPEIRSKARLQWLTGIMVLAGVARPSPDLTFDALLSLDWERRSKARVQLLGQIMDKPSLSAQDKLKYQQALYLMF